MHPPPPPHAYSSMVIPWIVPRVPPCIENWIRAKSQRRSYKARDVLLNETQPYDRLFFISSGVVAQGVVDASLYTKPLAINLFTGGRLMGTLNIITAVPSPRKLIALTDVEVYICSHRLVREELLTDLDLTLALMGYCELSAKSELIGMEVLFSMEPQKRLEILFSVLLLSDGTVDLNGRICGENRSTALGETYAKLPYTLPREAMRSVLYLSKSSFDRLLCDWSHSKGFVRDAEGDMWVDVERLTNALKWIREH